MKIQLSDHFDYKKLIRFTLPSILMMLFTSIYGVVDGFFISNVEGETAFAGINLIMPYCYIFGSFGPFIGVGGSALIAFMLGKGEKKQANEIFSMLVYTVIILSVILTIVSEILLEPAIKFLGANDAMYEYSLTYGRIFLLTEMALMLQYAFQTFFVTAEHPKLGFVFTLAAGLTNMILDFLFIVVFRWGVAGAAAATCIGQVVGGIGPIIYFAFTKNSNLKLGKATFSFKYLIKSCSNGLSELITNIALHTINIIYNIQLMKYIGEIGVSAYGIIMYVNLAFLGVCIGYSMGTAPVFSYHYGAGDDVELKNLFKRSIKIMGSSSVILTIIAIAFAGVIASIYAGYDEEFLSVATRALRLFSISYIFAGINIFTSNLFAAFNNGKISAILSFLRMFLFQIGAVFLLPLIIGADGIWLSMPLAELLVFIISILVLIKERKVYKYA